MPGNKKKKKNIPKWWRNLLLTEWCVIWYFHLHSFVGSRIGQCQLAAAFSAVGTILLLLLFITNLRFYHLYPFYFLFCCIYVFVVVVARCSATKHLHAVYFAFSVLQSDIKPPTHLKIHIKKTTTPFYGWNGCIESKKKKRWWRSRGQEKIDPHKLLTEMGTQ